MRALVARDLADAQVPGLSADRCDVMCDEVGRNLCARRVVGASSSAIRAHEHVLHMFVHDHVPSA
jgi:hypothetical protein